MRRIVDAARDRRILWSCTDEGAGGTMELAGAGRSWLELAGSGKKTAEADSFLLEFSGLIWLERS